MARRGQGLCAAMRVPILEFESKNRSVWIDAQRQGAEI
jgi:hypothetical protein